MFETLTHSPAAASWDMGLLWWIYIRSPRGRVLLVVFNIIGVGWSFLKTLDWVAFRPKYTIFSPTKVVIPIPKIKIILSAQGGYSVTAKHVCLYFIRRTTQPRHYRFFLIPPKNSLLKSSYPKKYLPNFRTQKNRGIENFKPPKNPLIIPITWNPEYPPWDWVILLFTPS